MINSDFLDDLNPVEAKEKIIEKLEKIGAGKESQNLNS